MNVLVGGSTGFVGTALCQMLRDRGDSVREIVRHKKVEDDITWTQLQAGDVTPIEHCDAVVNLAGAPIAGGKWTEKRKGEIRSSRVETTKTIRNLIDRSSSPPQVFVSGSAVGFYGVSSDGPVDETHLAGEGFLANVCKQWEDASKTDKCKVANIRTGIVIDSGGGMLAKLLPLFKLKAGGVLGSGNQPMSWISLADQVRAIASLINDPLDGPVNLTSPNSVTNKEFTEALEEFVNKKSIMRIPSFAIRLVFGKELSDSLILNGVEVRPSVLEQRDFKISYPNISDALAAKTLFKTS